MIAILRKKKEMSQYEVPQTVKKRIPDLVKLLQESESCPLYNQLESGTMGCVALASPHCYEKSSSKDFAQIDDYHTCGIYTAVARKSAIDRAPDCMMEDVFRTLR